MGLLRYYAGTLFRKAFLEEHLFLTNHGITMYG